MRLIRPDPAARIAGLLAGAALLIAACSAASTPSPSAAGSIAGASASSAASAGAVVIQVAQSPTVGAHLAGANGMTLYVFKKDSAGKSACTGSCATTWPPLTVTNGATATAGTGVTGTLGTMSRDDGSTQVTYDGAPLYYYSADQKAGDTTGQGIGGIWFVATPSGTPGASASPSASSGGYGGYAGSGASLPEPPSALTGTAVVTP